MQYPNPRLLTVGSETLYKTWQVFQKCSGSTETLDNFLLSKQLKEKNKQF